MSTSKKPVAAAIALLEHLSHRYAREWAIRDINLAIPARGVLGLLGSNGAGKSTTMNILCGVINQTEGEVYIDGIDLRKHPVEAKRCLGFLPQKAPLYPELTVDEYLRYCASLRDVPKAAIGRAVEAVKAQCGLAAHGRRLLANLSGGYQQRVGIAQAIIHSPKLVVLDEPANGLDPNQIQEVRKLIRQLAEERAVILSTHILSEVQATCDRIAMIERGRIVFDDTLSAFDNHVAPNSFIAVLAHPPATLEALRIPDIIAIEQVDPHRFRCRFVGGSDITAAFIARAVAAGWGLTELYLEKTSLDGIFYQLSKQAAQDH
ncbi:ABC transporter ATP-binding protein [Parapedobacter koreensis]|uniref:ABC-2 type transport system ATP-binding protein n=1 Tax=Parapedobacter koreensis TaxID=332977 RepID=A0A1H7U722_9SPHI|nr:ABC transporter ATP-binding protein [Parapedobacter koreensis]SEL92850.1 ABC-2 type transport system ATP-binding protein [Parapedobacter koreensis]